MESQGTAGRVERSPKGIQEYLHPRRAVLRVPYLFPHSAFHAVWPHRFRSQHPEKCWPSELKKLSSLGLVIEVRIQNSPYNARGDDFSSTFPNGFNVASCFLRLRQR